MEANTTARKPKNVAACEKPAPADVKAPTKVIPEIAFEPLIRGV